MYTNVLKIEIDGHFHGSSDVPKPWVAEILGPCSRYGLQRKFLDTLNDWSQSHRAWSGNVYGRVAHFPLREGRLYEVSRCRGGSSRRYVAREFIAIVDGKRKKLEPEDALARADGRDEAVIFRLPEDRDGTSWVAEITRLGTPKKLGFVVVDTSRVYRLGDGVHEVVETGGQRLVGVRDLRAEPLTQEEALTWL